MSRLVRICIGSSVGLLLTVLALLILLPGGLELSIRPVKGGPPVLVLPLLPGERFTLHYYHSVENAPIWEEHSLDKSGRIYIEEERYLKFGAGMGRRPILAVLLGGCDWIDSFGGSDSVAKILYA